MIVGFDKEDDTVVYVCCKCGRICCSGEYGEDDTVFSRFLYRAVGGGVWFELFSKVAEKCCLCNDIAVNVCRFCFIRAKILGLGAWCD